jgi:hypothetical protein
MAISNVERTMSRSWDDFALGAMVAILAGWAASPAPGNENEMLERLAYKSFLVADKMIEARDKARQSNA